MSSVHTNNKQEIYTMPFKALTKPTAQELEEDKVESLMETLEGDTPEDVPPIDVLWVTTEAGNQYYFAMGGCHRYEAHKRLGRDQVRVKLIKGKPKDVALYLGEGVASQLK